jgi:hypothetical protein
MSDQLDDILQEEQEKERRKREAVGQYLEMHSKRQDSVLAQKGQMAGSTSFTFTQTLKWIGSDVKLASDLPFLSAMKDPETGEIVIDAGNIDLVRQRPVDWSRQVELSRYLASEPLHQFPPLLLVITSSWAEDPESPKWVNGRAVESTFDYQSFGSFDGIVELNLDPSKYLIYALDGQHRVVGIRGALEMINSSLLQPKNKKGQPVGKPIPMDDWLDTSVRSRADVDMVPAETIGVQLIPGVLKGETIEDARRRIATVFVHVNQTAAPLKDGELTQIDRNDGPADVARYIATKHPFLSREKRVNFSNNTLSKRSTQITTLSTLKTCTRLYLREFSKFGKWDGKVGRGKAVSQRPPENEILEAREMMTEVWDHILALNCFTVIDQDPKVSIADMRNFTSEGGEAHMLYRPIGQQALVEALAQITSKNGVLSQSVLDQLDHLDKSGGFRLDNPTNPWYGVLYNESLGKMVVSGQKLAARLLVYMLDDVTVPERESLKRDFAEARKSREGYGWDIDGSEVSIDQVRLPAQLH